MAAEADRLEAEVQRQFMLVGWPEDPATEEAIDHWLYAPDAQAQSLALRRVQETSWNSVPFAPTGIFVLQTGFRADLSGVLQGPNPYLWNLRRA